MTPNYIVGVVGGACAGSEIAHQLRKLGMEVVVFEQGSLPYGKIEDGLPRWHKKLQIKEKAKIDEKLSQDGIHFIPNCTLGKDISLQELLETWRLPLLVFANGAWRDRELRVDGAATVVDDSLVYQNAFVYWFNHYLDANYRGPCFEVPPAPVIIGGGLASVDMVKICQYELARKAFAVHGIAFDAVTFDHYGIGKTAEKHGMNYADLGIKPARLFYRKRVEDMPLMPMGENPDAKKIEKAKLVRAKLIRNATHNFGFQMNPLCSPSQIHTENGSVVGVTFTKNRYHNGRFQATDETEYVSTSLIISSIGSIPQPLPGIPMNGELYDAESEHTGALSGLKGVYCVGNAITGRGNIKESFKNAARLGTLFDAYYTKSEPDYEKWFKLKREEARNHVAIMYDYLSSLMPMSAGNCSEIRQKVRELQAARGYDASFVTWRDRILAAR